MTFRRREGNFDFPDPRYLEMHAACCRVAQLSGAADYMDDIMDNLDKGQTKVLPEDGSCGRILEFALLASGVCRWQLTDEVWETQSMMRE